VTIPPSKTLSPDIDLPHPNLTRRQAHSDPAAVPDVDFQGPTGNSGKVRGGANLIGNNPANPIQIASTQIPISELQLAKVNPKTQI